jgi:hypothetical protein
MNKTQAEQLTNDVLILDVLLRLKTLETLLVSKGLVTQEEYDAATQEISSKIMRTILERSNVPGDLDVLIKDLQAKSKPTGN